WGAVGASLVPLGGAVAIVWRWIGGHTGRLRVPVMAYIGVITAMVALATGVWAGVPGGLGLFVAAVLFFCSDLFVARQRFLVATPWNRYVGLPLYYAAQVVFAFAATRV
ncbi:MAG: hypothetical protein KC656_37880, partial [Myxococcales bacterium]|nr:hypothetical protein [Myxococcales bacterium]